MPIQSGTRFGPYEILAPIGVGGMGEVYRARDTRLARTVAIKVLSEHVSTRPEGRERFEREAQTIAGLSHPGICALYDVGVQDGAAFLVMEHLEGETLAHRLARGALPLEEALRYAAEIAEALAEAHRHGVVHRDLKPANVMLTRSGAKLLDFGLAKLRASDGGTAGEDRTLTAEHALVGTLPYMAPEQLEGAAVDARTDIFALGALTYEMATGVRAFEGGSQASLIASILRGDVPPLASRQPVAPHALDRLVQQCLHKDPAKRWQSAQDVALRLREIGRGDLDAGPQQRRRLPRWTIPALGVALLASALVGAVASQLWRRAPELSASGTIVRSSVDLLPGTGLTGYGFRRTELALGPDGRMLVWSASPDGSAASAMLYRRPLDSDEVKPIPGTDGGRQPFFSPDGRWVGFYDSRGGRLRKIAVEGGLAVDLAESGPVAPMGASWAADGKIVLGNQGRGLDWIPAEGGSARALTTVDSTREVGHRLPWVLPGGQAVLFTTVPHLWGVRARVEAVLLGSGARTVLVEDAADARYLTSGHLVFVRQGVLMAARFDPVRLKLLGPPVPVLADVRQALNMGADGANSGAGQFVVSSSGLLVHASGGIFEDRPAELVLVDAAGRVEPLPGFEKPLTTGQIRFSPDGRQVAFTEKARSGLAWVFDIERKTQRALSHEGISSFPIWSPAGDRIVLGWSAAGPLNLWLVPVDGGGEWQRLTDGIDLPSCWTPDGRAVVLVRTQPGRSDSDIFLYRFEDRQVVRLLAAKADEGFPEISPDGQWMAYSSNETGRDEVLVTSFPDCSRTLVVSREGGTTPAWSRDGETLYYLSLDQTRVLAVAVSRGTSLRLGSPTVRFRLPAGFLFYRPVRSYDIHPDGSRLLVSRLKGTPHPLEPVTRLRLIQNWFSELESLSPGQP
ncbi:MAG TPA: protein kinase [Vicinamibacteria bacterium]|nr:protein kinase [Vicinamibacteria bacterium]